MTALSQPTAAIVRDILHAPPEDNPYDHLRLELICHTSESEQNRLQKLLTAEELGDRKPSELLRRMQQPLGDKAGKMDPSILKDLFLQRLSNHVRMILCISESDSIATLARMADQIMEVGSPAVFAVSSHKLAAPLQLCTRTVQNQLAQLGTSNEQMSSQTNQLTKELSDL